jgi:ABC-type transporter Mla subunit MlaD
MMILPDLFATDTTPNSTLEIIARNVIELGKHVERLNESLAGVMGTLDTLDAQIMAVEKQLAEQRDLLAQHEDNL